MRIAVVGSGAAGLAAAWALNKQHDVVLFEQADRPGGHANTVDVPSGGQTVPIDTGFIVCNDLTYPHLLKLFEALGVKTRPSDMSFAVSLQQGRIEYAGSFPGLFARPLSVFSRPHWRMISDIVRFYRSAPALLSDDRDDALTLGEFLARDGYGREFIERHLLPMAAAIWSAPQSQMMAFPARSLIRFCVNHRLLDFVNRPQWLTVEGGSREYVTRIIDTLDDGLRLGTPVRAVRRTPVGVYVSFDGGEERFDQLVLASHGDQTRQILGADASQLEAQVLGAFEYQPNRALLHRDASLMPKRRRVWASWNYIGGDDANNRLHVSYWMNRLQGLDGVADTFVTLNPLEEPHDDLVLGEFQYEHPIFDTAAMTAQSRLPQIQGVNRTWFCGSYCGYGFHEDAIESGLAVAAALGAPVHWWHDVKAASPAAQIAQPPFPQAAE